MPYRSDANQPQIIDALRRAGCSVTIIGGANGNTGVPDLLVGRLAHQRRMWPAESAALEAVPMNYLLEVKRPWDKSRGDQGELSPEQVRWHANWRGQVAVVRTVEEALAAVGLGVAGSEAR